MNPAPTFNWVTAIDHKHLILKVNNAASSGVIVDEEGLRAMNIDPLSWVCLYVFSFKAYSYSLAFLYDIKQKSLKQSFGAALWESGQLGSRCGETDLWEGWRMLKY